MKTTGDDAIINPRRGKMSPPLGSVAVMASAEADLGILCPLLGFDELKFKKLFNSRLYANDTASGGVSLTGPLIGAPYAVMLLETLIAWGATKIIFLGWCGAISPLVKLGDIILVTAAMIDEGTSGHYAPDQAESRPSERLVAQIRQLIRNKELNCREGAIWSTDAVYRETRQKVELYQSKDVLAVEMETSALFTVAGFRKIEVAAVLVVSDELSTFKWRPGFKDDKFKKGRIAACGLLKRLCQTL
jgi:uridine phosphorylase